jgi:hypothetical protein
MAVTVVGINPRITHTLWDEKSTFLSCLVRFYHRFLFVAVSFLVVDTFYSVCFSEAKHLIFDTHASLDEFLPRALREGWAIGAEMPRITTGRQFSLKKGDKSILVTMFPNHASILEDGRHSLYVLSLLLLLFFFFVFAFPFVVYPFFQTLPQNDCS